MTLVINRLAFPSYTVRRQVTGNTGIRQVQSFNSLTSTGGFFRDLFDSFKGFIVNAGKLIGNMLKFSVTQIVEWFFEAVEFIWTFNWDISDDEINLQIKRQWYSLETRIFGILGRSFGSLLSVGIGGAIAFYVNPLLAKLLLAQIADDLFAELIIDFSGLVQQALRGLVVSGFLSAYKSARQLIKKAYKNPKVKALALKAGISQAAIDSWGDKDVQDWSFAKQKNDFVESIGDEQLQNNIEEFIEEATDGFRDTALSMANIWDAMQFRGRREESQTLIYQPDRSQSEEFYLHGTSDEILSQAIQVNNFVGAMNNRDIGNYVVTEDDQPVITNNGIAVTLVFLNTIDTPYGLANQDNFAKAELIIPNIDRSKFTWEKLEELFRPSAFTDGNFKGEFDLENGRKLVTRGASKQECNQLAKNFLQLTELKMVGTPQYTERDGATTSRWKPRKRQPMYLNHFYIRNYPRATKYEQIGRLSDAKKSITTRFDFKKKRKPVNFDYRLREAFSTSIDSP
mgnify:CR=1 FL=1